jgi:hypothetical protein
MAALMAVLLLQSETEPSKNLDEVLDGVTNKLWRLCVLV